MHNHKSLVFSCLFVSYSAIYIARLNFSMASPELKEAGIMNAEKIGLMGSIFLVLYALGRLINGTLSDTIPPWVMIFSGLSLCGIANILLSFLPSFWTMALLWGLNAFAQSMLWSSVLRVLIAIYDKAVVKKKTTYMVAAVTVGNILGIIVNSALISSVGVRFAFVVPGLFMLICATAVLIFVRKTEIPAVSVKKHIPMYGLLREKNVCKQLIPAVMHGVMKDNITVWMALYFVDKYAIDLNRSTLFMLFIPVLSLLPRLGYYSVYRLMGRNEHKVSIFSFVVCIPATLTLCIPVLPSAIAAICLAVVYSAVSLANTSILSLFPLRYSKSGNVASISGLMDFATYFGAGMGSLAYGYVVEVSGYMPMFISWAVISLISIIPLTQMVRGFD